MAAERISDFNYFIVEFDDGVQLVPKNWIVNGKNEAYWPNFTNLKNYNKAVETMIEVEDSWKTYTFQRILGKSSK